MSDPVRRAIPPETVQLRPSAGTAAGGRVRAGAVGLTVAVALVWGPRPLPAQDARPDSSDLHPLGSIVVTADRSEGMLAFSTGSVSVLERERLEDLPVRDLADALGILPGFSFLDTDGLGYAPRPTVRGFYGGGETEYVQLLLDGRPLNFVETGAVNWNLLPLSAVESIEVLRGGSSSLWGDAAVGGVVNVRTRRDGAGGRFSVAGGSYGSFAGRGSAVGELGGRRYSAFANVESTDGFRDHAERDFGSVGGTLSLIGDGNASPSPGSGGSLALSALGHWREFQEPGPLTGEDLAESRTGSADFYRFDRVDETSFRLGLDGGVPVGSTGRLSGAVSAERRDVDRVRTLPLSPDFADTKNRVFEATRFDATVQATGSSVLLRDDRVSVGVEGSLGLLDTRYHEVITGGLDVYSVADGGRGPLDARGDGRRLSGALFLQYDWHPVSRVRLTVGARMDALDDEFEPEVPEDAERADADHSAFSPKAGINVRYTGTGRHVGHAYLSVGRSFKSPTLDQLFDQRTTPVPFPPFSVTISNPELVPQTGTSVEAGLYHRADVTGTLAGTATLSVYEMDMEDELDFDLQTFRFVNIGESRHRGVEAGLRLDLDGRGGVFFNYTLQDVTARIGPNEGKQLKAVPRTHLNAGVRGTFAGDLSGSVAVSRADDIWLDDANTVPLPAYTTVQGRLAYAATERFSVFLAGSNLLDETYSATGFPDPAGSDVLFFHPAAGRTVRVGVQVRGR